MRNDRSDHFNKSLYLLFRQIVRIGLRLFWRVRVTGRERVPAEGAVLLCINHIGAVDALAVSAALVRPVHVMSKIELFSRLGWLLSAVGAFPVKRNAHDMRAVRQTLRLMRQGRVVALFPEGHRQNSGVLGQPHSGSGSLIAHCGAVVIPVAIRGSWKLWRRVEIKFGPPLDVSDSEDPAGDVMRAIARLYYRSDELGLGFPWTEP